MHVGGERLIGTAEGNGPVNALDKALRLAITQKYPHLSDIELVNYKVRILDEAKGTGAVTRVLLDASDGEESWGSIGVSENIIEASWEALVDSIEYGMLRAGAGRPWTVDAEDTATHGDAAGRRLRPGRGRRRGAALPLRRRRRALLDRPAWEHGAARGRRARSPTAGAGAGRCRARWSPSVSTTARTPPSSPWTCRPSRSSSSSRGQR